MIEVIKTTHHWSGKTRRDSVTFGNKRLWLVRMWPLNFEYPNSKDHERGLSLDIKQEVVLAKTKEKAVKLFKDSELWEEGQAIEARSLMVISENI